MFLKEHRLSSHSSTEPSLSLQQHTSSKIFRLNIPNDILWMIFSFLIPENLSGLKKDEKNFLRYLSGDPNYFNAIYALLSLSLFMGSTEQKRITALKLEHRTIANGTTVALGAHHSMVIAYNAFDGGKIYSWGYPAFGRLGGNYLEDQQHPQLLESRGGHITSTMVAANYLHNLILTTTGKIFSFGHGGWGRLGHGNTKHHFYPRFIQTLHDKNIVMIAISGSSSMALTEKGEVYIWGRINDRKISDKRYQSTPFLVEELSDKRIISIKANCSIGLALTVDGEVFICPFRKPRDNHDQNDTKEWWQPYQLESLPSISAISASNSHILFLTRQGELFITNNDLDKTRVVTGFPKDSHIIAIETGNQFSATLTDDGKLYTWGEGALGKLGHGDKKDQSTPKLVAALSSEKIIAIKLGSSHIFAINDQGEIFSWGLNSHGQLGHGDNINRDKPAKIKGFNVRQSEKIRKKTEETIEEKYHENSFSCLS